MESETAYCRGGAYGECMRCGFTRRLSALCREWSGLRVCRDTCLDPKPAGLKPPVFKPEGVVLPNASPETTPIFGSNYDGSGL